MKKTIVIIVCALSIIVLCAVVFMIRRGKNNDVSDAVKTNARDYITVADAVLHGELTAKDAVDSADSIEQTKARTESDKNCLKKMEELYEAMLSAVNSVKFETYKKILDARNALAPYVGDGELEGIDLDETVALQQELLGTI